MKFYADLHIHSKYSRATAKNLDIETIYLTSQIKGLNLVATGDFTHPAWIDEIVTKLEPDHSGLFDLKPEIKSGLKKSTPEVCRRTVKFILCTEISNIYKKDGKTRKNHNLVFFPSLSSVRKFNSKLSKLGNLESDGRPIIGIDSRDLLEIVLETDKEGVLIPAHIWTPWFSMLGSKSGFDSVEECFGDLADEIFALETGLSSDPEMNWKVSDLDKYFLVSNSDAHSPSKLAREANIFDTDLSYYSLFDSLKGNKVNSFKGTLEFFPEEGKYHIDGHRKCGFSCFPSDAVKLNNICPVCGNPLTLGVLHRVEQLADREKPFRHAKSRSFHRLIQLEYILAELLEVGPRTKKVSSAYNMLINNFGSEIDILLNIKITDLKSVKIYLLDEAIRRIRRGKVNFKPGYDGIFGKISVFSKEERENFIGQKQLFIIDSEAKYSHKKKNNTTIRQKDQVSSKKVFVKDISEPNEKQEKIISHNFGPILIVAGPGTGKTYTITKRISRLIKDKIVEPEKVLVVTFTNKAADELNDRLNNLLNGYQSRPTIGTFHSICLKIIGNLKSKPIIVIDEVLKIDIIKRCKQILKDENLVSSFPASKFSELFSLAKQSTPFSNNKINGSVDKLYFNNLFIKYQQVLSSQNLFDYDDLIAFVINNFKKDALFSEYISGKFDFIFVDEYQDINPAQYELIKCFCTKTDNICAIGDPDQSIYGFRGSDVSFFKKFIRDFPKAVLYQLSRNYRSTNLIVSASNSLIDNYRISILAADKQNIYSTEKSKTKVTVIKTSNEKAEAIAIGRTIEQLIGGSGFHSIDFGKFDYTRSKNFSFADFAVLFRTSNQIDIFKKVFLKAGIPYRVAKNDNMFHDQLLSKIISFMRVIGNCATFSDFEILKSILPLKVRSTTLDIFFKWIIEKGITLNRATSIIEKIPVGSISIARQRELFYYFQHVKRIRNQTNNKPIDYIIDYIVSKLKYNDCDNIREKISFLKRKSTTFGYDLKGYLSTIALQKDHDALFYNVEKVSFLTMHSSKGLEFTVVFIAGCEDGLVPYKKNGRSNQNDCEERRLFYVAMTRAMKKLYLTYSEKRSIFGKTKAMKPSPFLNNLGKQIKYIEVKREKIKNGKDVRQLYLFDQ